MKDDVKCFQCDKLLITYTVTGFGRDINRISSYVSMYVSLSTGSHSETIRICLNCFLDDAPSDLVRELTKGIDKDYRK